MVPLSAIYGLRAAFDLAYHGGAIASDPKTTGLAAIARRQAIPANYAEQILRKLRQAGVVKVRRGRSGGYELGRPPERISLNCVLDALAADPFVLPKKALGVDPCSSALGEAMARARRAFGEETLADLCARAERLGVPRGAPAPMYFI